MNYMNGGYVMIDLQSITLQTDLQKAYELHKPIVVYLGNKQANYARVQKIGSKYFAICDRQYWTITASGKDENDAEFSFVLGTDIMNYKDIIGETLLNHAFTFAKTDETIIGGNNVDVLTGKLDWGSGFVINMGTSNNAEYIIVDINGATDITISY